MISASTRDGLETTAFINADGQIVVVVLNQSEKRIPFALKCGNRTATTESLPRSIMTLRFAEAD